jgi:putative tryptophan/tyrosine transport system substrate-binding protein
MRRREFITLVGSAVAAWPLAAFGKTQRIAIFFVSFPLSKMTETSDDPLFKAFFSGLRRLGYVEGQSLVIERYSGEGRASHYADLARDIVNRSTWCRGLPFRPQGRASKIVEDLNSPAVGAFVAEQGRPKSNIAFIQSRCRRGRSAVAVARSQVSLLSSD